MVNSEVRCILSTYTIDGALTTSPFPVAVDATGVLANKTVVSISAGDGFSIVLTSDGKLYSWGMNGYGALGVSFYHVILIGRMEHKTIQLFLLLWI
jgi:hypothetical protein